MLVLLEAWDWLECMPTFPIKGSSLPKLTKFTKELSNNYQTGTLLPDHCEFLPILLLFTLILFLCSVLKQTSIVVNTTPIATQ